MLLGKKTRNRMDAVYFQMQRIVGPKSVMARVLHCTGRAGIHHMLGWKAGYAHSQGGC